MNQLTRRHLLGSLAVTAGTSLLAGCNGKSAAETTTAPPTSGQQEPRGWTYVAIDPATAAAEAYRVFPEGGCMYGLFAGIMMSLAKVAGEPFASFPCHMMRFGEGGVGGWGTLCGTLGGGAAILGLFELDKAKREKLIAELFSWYERASLPTYRPQNAGETEEMPKSVAKSVLCHMSVGAWRKESGYELPSKEMGERCRRLTADVAAKTVELLNHNQNNTCALTGPSPETEACITCHGKAQRGDSLGKMNCGSCHTFSGKHP